MYGVGISFHLSIDEKCVGDIAGAHFIAGVDNLSSGSMVFAGAGDRAAVYSHLLRSLLPLLVRAAAQESCLAHLLFYRATDRIRNAYPTDCNRRRSLDGGDSVAFRLGLSGRVLNSH